MPIKNKKGRNSDEVLSCFSHPVRKKGRSPIGNLSCFSRRSTQKRATTKISDNFIGMLIATAGVIIMLFLLIRLFSPVYDVNEETAKSYIELFNEQINSADGKQEGSLTFWAPDPKDLKFYLVYFGDVSSFREGELTFVTRKKNKNTVCICYGDDNKMKCSDCNNLDLPVEFKMDGRVIDDPWILDEVKHLKINKLGDKYLFSQDS